MRSCVHACELQLRVNLSFTPRAVYVGHWTIAGLHQVAVDAILLRTSVPSLIARDNLCTAIPTDHHAHASSANAMVATLAMIHMSSSECDAQCHNPSRQAPPCTPGEGQRTELAKPSIIPTQSTYDASKPLRVNETIEYIPMIMHPPHEAMLVNCLEPH